MKRNLVQIDSNLNLTAFNASSNKIYAKIGKLIKITDDLKECGCLHIDFLMTLPKIILLGPPASGKTSIIESLLGVDILPKGEDCAVITRRPIEIKMTHVPNQIEAYVELQPEEGEKQPCKIALKETKQIKQKIVERIEKKVPKTADKSVTVSREPVRITIYSNTVPDATVVDLPGVDEEIKNSRDIAYSYIKEENSIILNVQNADRVDFNANCMMSLIGEVDTDFSRTIGVITKVDLVQSSHNNPSNPLSIVKTLLEQNDPGALLKHGFVAVKSRSSADTISTIEDNLHKEREYFSTHPVFKFVSITDHLTVDSLGEKIKRALYHNNSVKKNLLLLHKSLKEKTQECQNELVKFGTDYIGYTNDTKNTYVTALINNFCESIERVFSGKLSDVNDSAHNVKLKETYYDFLKNYKTGYIPGAQFKNEEIVRIIQRTEGEGLSGFPESEVVYALLEAEMDKLRDEVKIYLDTINDLVRESVKNLMFRVFCRFPKLMDKIEELMNLFIEENFEKMKYLVESVAEMNFNYLYIDESSLSYNKLLKKFVLNDENASVSSAGSAHSGRERSNTLTSALSQNSQERPEPRERVYNEFDPDPNKDSYYNGLAEYVKILINYFFSIMIRNLRESVPKVTGFYFIRSLKNDVRFYLLNEVSKEFSYENFLEEDPEVARTRNFYIDLMKVLKNCDKIVLYDEDLKNAIRGDKRKTIEQIMENNAKMVIDTSSKTNRSENPESRRISEVDKKISNYEKRDSSSTNSSFFKEETKMQNKNESYSSQSSRIDHILKNSGNNPNMNKNPSSSALTNQSSQNVKNVNAKNSIQNILKEEEPKKQPIQRDTTPIRKEQPKEAPKEAPKDAPITIKMDPNSSDIKDMKINVNMDADTAFNFYQTNKKYLPTGQQVMSGLKATADFAEKSANAIEGSNTASSEIIVTGNKPAPKKNFFDPLTSLFGPSKKETGKSSSNSNNTSQTSKKGQF